jgi:hypothetical protein
MHRSKLPGSANDLHDSAPVVVSRWHVHNTAAAIDLRWAAQDGLSC